MRSFLLLPLLLSAGVAFTGCGGSTTAAGYVPLSRQQSVLPDSLNLGGCSSSTMGGGLLAVCDPVLLKRAYDDHTLNKPGTLEVAVAGRKLRVGGNPGLTQVLPDDGIGILTAPATVTLRGKASDGSYLYLRAGSSTPEHLASGEALFLHLGLEHGGTATVHVTLEHGEVRFAVRRPDGSVLKPLRLSHLEGLGPQAGLPELPAHYADTPQQGVSTYIAAINARDGKTVCELWTAQLRAGFGSKQYPCWAMVTGLIDYGGESDSRIFQRSELLTVGKPYSRVRSGVSFTAVPVTVRGHYLASRYSNTRMTDDRNGIVWFQQTKDGWRITKDTAIFGSGRNGEDASAPPDPYAALHAKQAGHRKQRADRAASRRSLVELGHTAACPHSALTLTDPIYDVKSMTDAALGGHRADGGADIITASLSFRGQRACFSISFRDRPLTGRERIALNLIYTPADPSQRRFASFLIDNGYGKAAGLHAGLSASPAMDGLAPAEAQVSVDANTLRASFALPSSFPAPSRKELGRFGWTITSYEVTAQNRSGVSDSAEAGLTEAKLAAAAERSDRARQAREKAAQEAQITATWAPALVHFNAGSVRCSGRQVKVEDAGGAVMFSQRGTKTAPGRAALGAMTDIRAATVAVSDRHVCLSVSFAKQPFGRHQRRIGLELGIDFTYRTATAPYLQQVGFVVETNVHLQNGLTYAGLPTNGGATHPDPAHSHLELRGNTLMVGFDLEPSFPALHPAQLKNLSWRLGFFTTDLAALHAPVSGYLHFHDEIPNNPDRSAKRVSPAVRQSDGKTITPY